MNTSNFTTVELERMIKLFYQPSDSARCLGTFQLCEAADLPQEAHRMLAHNDHMTVTLESALGCPVNLKVLSNSSDPTHYARKIVLTSQTDQTPVMFGLVRVNLQKLENSMQQAIQQAEIPLGRILIESDLLRRVSLVSLYQIEPGQELLRFLGTDNGQTEQGENTTSSHTFYGRTAIIFLDGLPIIELLEIVKV